MQDKGVLKLGCQRHTGRELELGGGLLDLSGLSDGAHLSDRDRCLGWDAGNILCRDL